MKKYIALLIAVLMLAAIVPATFASQKDSSVVVQITEEPTNLDVSENATLMSLAVTSSCHDKLVYFANGEVKPQLAESWSWNEDFTKLTYKIRDDATFSDGSSVTSEDVKFSLEYIKAKGAKSASTYAMIDSFDILDEKTITINLKSAYTPLLNMMCDTAFCIFSKAAIEGGMDLAKGGEVVSGPYRVTEWKNGAYIILTANENYYQGTPAIKTIKFLFMPDENNSIVALEAGEVDYVTGTSFNLGGTTVEYLKSGWGTKIVEYSSTNYVYLVLNQSLECFADTNVRKAIDVAINRKDIAAVALDGYANPTSIPALPNMSGYIAGYEAPEQNIEKAKEYLAASAYPNGFTFSINCINSTLKKAAQVIQDELKQIGITVNIVETDVGTQVTNNAANNYEAFIWSFGNPTGDVAGLSLMYDVGGNKNYARSTDPTIQNAFAAANASIGEERLANLKVAFDAMMDQVPYIGLYFPTASQATNENLVMSDGALSGSGIPYFYFFSWK